ncbi:hypothetical protein [Bacillus sp. FSL E2-8887]
MFFLLNCDDKGVKQIVLIEPFWYFFGEALENDSFPKDGDKKYIAGG